MVAYVASSRGQRADADEAALGVGVVIDLCPGCHCPVTSYCRDVAGTTLPMCRGDRCSEHTSNDNGLCRDCDLEQQLADMECPRCRRMRYRTNGLFAAIGASLWGKACDCR